MPGDDAQATKSLSKTRSPNLAATVAFLGKKAEEKCQHLHAMFYLQLRELFMCQNVLTWKKEMDVFRLFMCLFAYLFIYVLILSFTLRCVLGSF